MKKAIILLLLLLAIINLCACTSNKEESSTSTPKNTSTSTPKYTSTSTPRPTPKKYTRSEIEDQAAYSLYVKLKNDYSNSYNIDATTYSIGSVTELQYGKYKVAGTLSLYDDFGRFKTSKTFWTVITPGDSSPSLVFIN